MQGAQASSRYRSLMGLSLGELLQIMRRGETPDFDRMAGWEYKGFNRPGYLKLLGIQKFVKGFYRDPTGMSWGYNEPVRQNGPDGPWIARPSPERPKRFAFYRVRAVDPRERDHWFLQALLLDYGQGPNPPWEPAKFLRDYLVRIEPGSDDLLLGAAGVALGHARVPTNFFILERFRETGWRPSRSGPVASAV
jgi:hypothetical protein